MNNVADIPVKKKRNILDEIVTTKPRAPRITLYGKPGVGKSTFASKFPNPLFLLTENPSLNDIQALPVARHFLDFWDNIKELNNIQQPPFKTLVIDSVSKLDALIVNYILEEEGANITAKANKQKPKITTLGAAAGGYGKGYERAQSLHRAVKLELDKFVDKGIALIFISHLAITKYRAPDAEDYDVYSIVMNHDKSREVYIDDVDMVGFCKLKSFVSTSDSGRHMVTSTDERIISATLKDSHVSKNRFNLTKEIAMEFEELAKYIPYYSVEKELNNES